MGRSSKLNPEVEERILDLLRAGNRRTVAVRAAGVGESTFFRWLADDRPRYREFREAVERAEAEAEVALVEAVVKGIPKNPILAYKMLENRSADWRRWRIAPEPVVVETPPPPVLTAGPTGLTVGQLRRHAMEQARSRRGEPPEGVSEEEMAKRRRLVTDSADLER